MHIKPLSTLSLPFTSIWLPSVIAIIASASPITVKSSFYSHLANPPRIETYIIYVLALIFLSSGVILAHTALKVKSTFVRARYIINPRKSAIFLLVCSYTYLIIIYYPIFISSISGLSAFEIRDAQLDSSNFLAVLSIYFNIFIASVFSGIYFKNRRFMLSLLLFICSLVVIYISLQKSLMLLFLVSFSTTILYSPVDVSAGSKIFWTSKKNKVFYWLAGLIALVIFVSLLLGTFALRQQSAAFESIEGSSTIAFPLFTYLGGASLRNIDMLFSLKSSQICPAGYNLFILKPLLWLLNQRDGYPAVEEVGGINNLSSIYYYYCDAGLPGILLISLVLGFFGGISVLLALRNFVFFPAASVFFYASILFPFTDMFFDQSLPIYVLLSTVSARLLFFSSS